MKNSHGLLAPDVYLTPRPKDLIWPNLTNEKAANKTKTLIGFAFIFALSFGFVFLMGLLNQFVTIGNIRKAVPFVAKFLDSNPKLAGFLQSILGPVLLAVMLILVPIIMRSISRSQGKRTITEVEKSVFSKYFFFLVVQVFLVFSIFSLLKGYIQAYIDDGNFDKIKSADPKKILKTFSDFLVNVLFFV